jgi:hypothetical protein
MRYLSLLTILLLIAGCVPEDAATPKLHDIAFYNLDGSYVHGYFYGEPTTLQAATGQLVLTEGTADDPFAVLEALLVNGRPYLRQALEPLTASPVRVQRVPLSSDLTLETGSRTRLQAVVYFDGSRWFTLAENPDRGINTRVVPRERIEGLRNLGELNRAEAQMLQRVLEPRGPVVVGGISHPAVTARNNEGLTEYRRTALVFQTNIPANLTAVRPPVQEVTWDVLASGSQAVVGEGAQFDIATSQDQLLRLWNRAHGAQLTPPPVPDIDFRRDTVVAYFMGQRPSGGYGIQVTDVSVEGGEAYINMRLTEPGAGEIVTQALTSPWVMIRVPRPNLSVAWFRRANTEELVGVARSTR